MKRVTRQRSHLIHNAIHRFSRLAHNGRRLIHRPLQTFHWETVKRPARLIPTVKQSGPAGDGGPRQSLNQRPQAKARVTPGLGGSRMAVLADAGRDGTSAEGTARNGNPPLSGASAAQPGDDVARRRKTTARGANGCGGGGDVRQRKQPRGWQRDGGL